MLSRLNGQRSRSVGVGMAPGRRRASLARSEALGVEQGGAGREGWREREDIEIAWRRERGNARPITVMAGVGLAAPHRDS